MSRKNKILDLLKVAASDQSGFFRNFQGAVLETSTRDEYLSKKNNSSRDNSFDSLYNLSPEHEDSAATIGVATAPSMSTRYVPGVPGLSARHIGSGVYQNPLTGEIYDYNEGFTTGGKTYSPGDVSLQTSLLHFANHLDKLGLVKEADALDKVLFNKK